jgi:hypothetical protein
MGTVKMLAYICTPNIQGSVIVSLLCKGWSRWRISRKAIRMKAMYIGWWQSRLRNIHDEYDLQ